MATARASTRDAPVSAARCRQHTLATAAAHPRPYRSIPKLHQSQAGSAHRTSLFNVLWVGSTLLPDGRAGHMQLSDPQSKRPSLHRPHASCPGLEFLLAAHVPVSPKTLWKENPTQPEDVPRTEGLAQTCRAVLHCRGSSDDRRTRGSELPASGSASLSNVRHCRI